MAISQVQCADDLAVLASETVQQVRATKQFRDLIAAVLMANHVADWHYLKALGRKKFGDPERLEMESYYPEWAVLRKLANGTKHCKLQAQHSSLEWEHLDFWNSTGHVGEDGLDWFVEFDGEDRSVMVLIETFLEKFAQHDSRPS